MSYLKNLTLSAIIALTPTLQNNLVNDYKLTPKDVINYSQEYTITKAILPPTIIMGNDGFPRANIHFGITNTQLKEIYINKIVKDDIQKLALIHEFYHAKLSGLDVKKNSDETFVKKMSCETYKEWYNTKECPEPKGRLEDILKPEFGGKINEL